MSVQMQPAPAPWWRFRIVWFVAGLPAAAVAASVASAVIAMRHADPLVADSRPAAEDTRAHPMEPAEHARNHASLRR